MAFTATSVASPLMQFEGLRAQNCEARRDISVNTRVATGSRSATWRHLVVAERKAPKRKQVILTSDVPSLGKTGELLTVKRGYFRNFLFPFGKAKTATPQILKAIEAAKAIEEAERRAEKEAAEKVARQFQTIGGLQVRRKSSTGKQFFGSVTEQDIIDIIRANTGREIEKKNIVLPEIREIGVYTAEVKLHAEVVAQVKVNVIGK